MRILLVRPPITLDVAQKLRSFLHLEPLALEIVAGGFGDDHDVRILDLASTDDPDELFSSFLQKFQPHVLGFTSYSNQAHNAKDLARTARNLAPDLVIMAGGGHATMVPEDFKLPGVIDLVVRGEGGSVMPHLMQQLENGDGLPENDSFLPTDSPNFDDLADGPPPALPQFDSVPSPRRDLVNRSDYFCVWHGEKNEYLPELFPQTAALRTSVGCPNNCKFCVVPHLARGKYRQRPPEDAVRSIMDVDEDHIYFVDDEMFINARRCHEIARLLIENDVRKKYISWARADTICKHPDLFARWKQAGLSLLYVGLESMQPGHLDDYEKGIEPELNRRAVEILRDLDIGLHAALMVRPDFSREDFANVRSTIEEFSPAEFTFTVFSPPPGTPLWEQSKDDFICPDPYSFYDCMHTLVEPDLPLKGFYGQFSLLYLMGMRHNPWRHNRVHVKPHDFLRFAYRGARYGLSLRNIYRDYDEPELSTRLNQDPPG